MHLIDKHAYPKNFFFAITKDGIDGRQSLLVGGRHGRRISSLSKPHKRRSTGVIPENSEPGSGEGDSNGTAKEGAVDSMDESDASSVPPDEEMEDLAGAMSALKFVPASVKFGRRAGHKSGFARS
jgi:hypothetical protein